MKTSFGATAGLSDKDLFWFNESTNRIEPVALTDLKTTLNIGSAATVYVEIAGAAVTLDESHLGKILRCTNSNDVTVTVPAGLGAGFNCAIRKTDGGTNKITLVAGGGVTLVFPATHTKSDTFKNATVTLDSFDGAEFNLSGATAA